MKWFQWSQPLPGRTKKEYAAPVRSIEPWKGYLGRILFFSEPAKPVGPIPLVKNGRVRAPQNLRYTTYERLVKAKTLDELF